LSVAVLVMELYFLQLYSQMILICSEMIFENAYVIRIPSSKAPGRTITLAWFDTIENLLEDKPLLLLDNLKAHHNNTFLTELREFDVSVMFYPALTGCLIDPCDNAFHSTLKHIYLTKDRSTHQACVKSMTEAYYEISESAIKSFFYRCGYTSRAPASMVTRAVLSQGYEVKTQKMELLKSCNEVYMTWKHCFRATFTDRCVNGLPTSINDASLDGGYWQVYKK